MSIIMRGMGETHLLVTHGFGTYTAVDTTRPRRRRGRRPSHDLGKLKDPRLSIDLYTVTAQLISINGNDSPYFLKNTVRGMVDNASEFLIKPKGKIRIVKTRPVNNIFINVLKAFRKK